jgi:hypothetical protein
MAGIFVCSRPHPSFACDVCKTAALLTVVVCQLPSPLCSTMATLPSDDAVANARPSSCGAQATPLMDALCSELGVL